MIRAFLFFALLIPLTLYYSWKQAFMRKDRTLEELNMPGKLWAKRLLGITGVEVDADYGEMDLNGHYVFIVNHQSLVDIPILFTRLWDNNIRFVAKHTLFEIPVYGKALGDAGHISVDRSNRRAAMKSLNEAVEVIKKGVSPVIFPEGTRNTNLSELMDFKTGGMIMALKSGLPVVPIVMANTGRVLPPGKKWVNNKHVVRFKALPPIDPSRYTLKEREKFKDDLYELMNTTYKQMLDEQS